MEKFKGTPGPWFADIRGGCASVYQDGRQDDTQGCHNDDERNIVYSSKGAKFNGTRWNIDESVEHDFNLIAAAPELLEALQACLPWVNNGIARDAHVKAIAAIKKALGEKQ